VQTFLSHFISNKTNWNFFLEIEKLRMKRDSVVVVDLVDCFG